MSTQTVKIQSLGAQGDGIAHCPEGTVYVPFTLPGETVAIARVKDQGTIMSITEASPERREPACRHFGPDGKNGTCGGCSLQHVQDEPYHDFKRNLVVAALRSKGLDVEVDPLVICRPGERRRVVFTARKTEKGLLLGFSQANSHHIVAIEECPIAAPAIVSRLDAIRAVGLPLASNAEPFRITVMETLSGLDIAVDGIKSVNDKQRRALTETVLSMRGIARVSLSGEILIEPQKPVIEFGSVKVAPPAGTFVQATNVAEEAMAERVLAHVGKSKRIADLFCGTGTFTLRLARVGKVHGVEAEDKPLKSLDFAARNTPGLKPVTTERRDLFRHPLIAKELKLYDAVVFDPPRAGAEAQCKELARSTVKKIVAVSCNPLSFARDLSILVEGGYRITSVTPIDQFLWSPHVEAVATLEK
ncbi:class I SAM-dependent RNA methyltransferase [Agrobacterium sp. CNPSo 3708]|uniref:class I SAM-dependent RNA methyltransferase n=1 Tax=Agrobacterium sp. CNPSo 3708 TaxID=3028150 RepID=UPI0007149351|nr:class I SAM-dependent RNA methyltransferase [Agrobacterium sp. CNPSo 3708]KQZ97505.1 RNA methyltransferase [Rhizobium sp. Root564]MDD1496780.1 class I SAM-dependent RNA methyltransferase [Agrobacterium sp. CNPSo 3708]